MHGIMVVGRNFVVVDNNIVNVDHDYMVLGTHQIVF
jgi:hypothetical protein